MYKEVKVTKTTKKRTAKLDEMLGLDFLLTFPIYVFDRINSLLYFMYSSYRGIGGLFSGIKERLVTKMFWGRGSFYRTTFHFTMAGLTIFAIGTGLATKILAVETGTNQLTVSYAQGPTEDYLQQGSSIQTVIESNPNDPQVSITMYKVVAGDTLSSIAKQYKITKDTIRWANSKIILPFSDKVKIGANLRIPEMNGVLHKVRPGETAKKLATRYKAHYIDIIEINNLQGPKYSLPIGKEVFVPNGEVPPPPPSRPYIPPIDAKPGTFVNPLLHRSCKGYVYMRGFTGYHRGVDLSRGGGCPINAVASGRVIYAGFDKNWYAGYHVIIDHGGGVVTEYWHGNGTMWVKRGDYVEQGEPLMYMGTTGNSTGVHLHFILKKNGVAVNPFRIVPY